MRGLTEKIHVVYGGGIHYWVNDESSLIAGSSRSDSAPALVFLPGLTADLPYVVDCPALLICGDSDKVAAAMRYNRAWAATSGIPLYWVPDAGHNSNTDRPDLINTAVEDFCSGL